MAVEIKVPSVGESISEVTLSQWLKSDGDYVEMDEPIAEMESDKATFELTAEKAGILRIKAQEGDDIAVGELVCLIEEGEAPQEAESPESSGEKAESKETKAESEAPSEPKAAEEPKAEPQPAGKENGEAAYAAGHPSPAAAKILSEKGISPNEVKGSGKDGRITKDDALKAESSEAKAESKAPAEPEPKAAPGPAPAGGRGERRERMSKLRRTIARRLVQVKNETAMLTTFNEVDMSQIMSTRSKYKEAFKEKFGVGLGFMSFFAKACCQALREFPAVNGRIEEDEIVYNDFADISIAVSTPKGLVVPVIRNAESMSLDQIEAAVIELATKARDGKLTIEEMSGGTFTITNGGVFGSMLSTPIINAPQSAILGMHNIVERPVAVNGEVKIRPVMYVALSYDHRIIDGRESVSFLVRVKQLLEDPARLLLGV